MSQAEVLILAESVEDLKIGADSYDARQPGVGDHFWDSLLDDIETLEFSAGVHARHFGCHRMVAKHFPYAIFYRTRPQSVEVIAVLPLRRDPKWIERRLRARL
jgi:hypothetical protein